MQTDIHEQTMKNINISLHHLLLILNYSVVFGIKAH